jgi:hypothetical protein
VEFCIGFDWIGPGPYQHCEGAGLPKKLPSLEIEGENLIFLTLWGKIYGNG